MRWTNGGITYKIHKHSYFLIKFGVISPINMTKFFLIAIGLMVSFLGKAQETIPFYQQYLLDGEFLFNPAHLGKTDDIVLNGNYQKQFARLDESPNVQSIGLHANIVDRVGAGIQFFRDQNGPISANGIAAGASYFIPLSDDGERKDQFSFGTSVNLYNMNFDYTKIYPEDANDPLLGGSNSIFIAYANMGLQATYKNFFGGISINDIALNNDKPIVNGIEPSPTKYIVNAGYDWEISKEISIQPSTMVLLNTNSARMYDLNLIGKLKIDDMAFAGGVSYRSSKDRFGNEQLSLSPLIKVELARFNFGVVYNLGLSNIQTYGGNSFMLSLGYNFNNIINPRGFRTR